MGFACLACKPSTGCDRDSNLFRQLNEDKRVIVEAEYEEVDRNGDELDLGADDSLPWLEAEEEDDNAGAIAPGQVMGFAAILLLLLFGIVGSIWYFGGGAGDPEQVADGSVIEAPDTPYRERPEDPGGKEFDGTGNVAPVVGEGGSPEGVMATEDPGEDAGQGGDDNPSENGSEDSDPAPAPSSNGGVAVQLAAYTSRSRAEQGWNEISRRTDALSGMRYRIEQGVVDIGTVYRLQAVAGDRASADRLCSALKADGIDCQVKP